MCKASINSVIGIPSGPTTTIVVNGTSTGCKHIVLTLQCNGVNLTSPVIALSNPNWSFQFANTDCQCGEDILIEVCCTDEKGENIPGCECDAFRGDLPCEGQSECCLEFQENIQIDECDPQGKRLVTFNISFNITNANCLPYVLYLDFGDGNVSPPQVFNAVGSHVFTVSHLYDASVAAVYNAILNYSLNTDCSSLTIPVNIDACPPNEDCCPVVRNQINVGECDVDCARLVTVTTSFTPPPAGCPAAFLQWEYYTGGGITPFVVGPGFQTLGTSPHVETHLFQAAQSPVTAILKTIYPTGCPDVVETIIIPECDSPPQCPVINNFSFDIKDCRTVGDSCCRKVEFTVDGFFDLGCGTQQTPQIEITFGDGSLPEVRNIIYGGNQQFIFDHEYCTPGNYTVTLNVLYPGGCPSQTLQLNLPPCDLGEPVCPDITIDSIVISDDCNDDCEREVELYLTIKNPAPCNAPATFHIEWGDGDRHPNSTSITVPNSQLTLPFSHFYDAGQTYTITVVVDTPSGCSDLTQTVDIPACEDCDAEPCTEQGCLQFLCPIFYFMMVGGLALGILWFILRGCIPLLPASVGVVALGIGVLGLILYWLLCKCKPCGWLWLLLWKLFLGIGLLLIIFGACCNFWTYGLGLVLFSFLFFFIWRNRCDPSRCDIYRELTNMWVNILVPAYGYIIAVPLVSLCLMMIGPFSVYWIFTLIFGIIFLLFLACDE